MHRQRPTFTCCNCERPFGQSIDPKKKAETIVRCPYCHTECVVDLSPYLDPDSTPILRTTATTSTTDDQQLSPRRYRFPDQVPTRKPTSD